MRRTRLSAKQRRTEILNIAAKIANDKGLINVSLHDVGEQCNGINYHGVRYHFPTKRDLYQALIDNDLLKPDILQDAIDVGLTIDPI